jgi:hypothetical protein
VTKTFLAPFCKLLFVEKAMLKCLYGFYRSQEHFASTTNGSTSLYTTVIESGKRDNSAKSSLSSVARDSSLMPVVTKG